MSEVNDQFERFALERFESEKNVIDQEIAIHLVHFESTGDVVEDRRVVRFAESRLIEDVQRFERREFFSFVHLSLRHQFFELRRRHAVRNPLRIQRSMIRRTQIGQERGHFVERSSTDGFVISAIGEIITDLLLMIPEQLMKSENIGIADIGRRIGGGVLPVRRIVFHRLLFIGENQSGEVHRFADRQDEVRRQIERRTEIIVETTHVEFFGEDQIVVRCFAESSRARSDRLIRGNGSASTMPNS